MRGTQSNIPSKISEKPSEISEFDIAEAMREMVDLASDGDSRKSKIANAATALGLSYARAKALFYREARTIPAQEFINVSLRFGRMEADILARKNRREALRNQMRSSLVNRLRDRLGGNGVAISGRNKRFGVA